MNNNQMDISVSYVGLKEASESMINKVDVMKQALSKASGRSVEVLMQTAGKGLPILVKKELSSGNVPLSDTTAYAFI